jgi:hypothetical protein
VPVLVGAHKYQIDRFRGRTKAEREAQRSCFIGNRNAEPKHSTVRPESIRKWNRIGKRIEVGRTAVDRAGSFNLEDWLRSDCGSNVFFSSLKFTVVSVVKLYKSLFRAIVQWELVEWANALLEIQQCRLLGIPSTRDRTLVDSMSRKIDISNCTARLAPFCSFSQRFMPEMRKSKLDSKTRIT